MFNLAALLLIGCVLIAALWEHRLVNAAEDARAIAFNSTIRATFLIGFYPVVIFSLILFGFSEVRTTYYLLPTTYCLLLTAYC